MIAEQRRKKIFELIQEEGYARVSDLSKHFDVSEPTIRQDLEKLEKGGLVTRKHGGAFLRSSTANVQPMSQEHMENMDKKLLIARKAVEYVHHGETIILDAGSTTTAMIDGLSEKQNLKVMTNALNIVMRLGAVPGCTVFVQVVSLRTRVFLYRGRRLLNFFRICMLRNFFSLQAVSVLMPGSPIRGSMTSMLKRQ